MAIQPIDFIESADLGDFDEAASTAPAGDPLDLDKLPASVVSGTTLIDFSHVPDMKIRSGISEALLFASRAASAAIKEGDTEDDWLAAYTSNLGLLGFNITGSAVTKSTFKKTGLAVHKAIIPFLTVALGGAAIGPVILAGLQNLQEMSAEDPWMALFEKQTRRFNASEMHFAAASSDANDTTIRYAIARLNFEAKRTNILFFKLTKAEAEFESATKTLTISNNLISSIEGPLRSRLADLATNFIADAKL